MSTQEPDIKSLEEYTKEIRHQLIIATLRDGFIIKLLTVPLEVFDNVYQKIDKIVMDEVLYYAQTHKEGQEDE